MKMVCFLMIMVMATLGVLGQTNNYFGTSGTINGSVWSTSPGGPYTSLLNTTGGAIINFDNVATPTGATITVVGINATANTTFTTGGTLGTGGTIATITVASGIVLDLNAQPLSTAAGTGFIKTGSGILATGIGAYTGGFTINAGTVVMRGVNGMGAGGALTINNGIIAANATRDLTGKYTGGITVGGDFTLGSTIAPATSTANLTFSNNMSLGNSTTRAITIGGTGSYTLGGIISGTSSNLTINSTAAGSIILTGANTYSGTTTINGGTLQLNQAGGTTIPATNNVIINGGVLRISSNQTLNNLTLSTGATLTIDLGVTLTINGTFFHNGGTITATGTIAYGSLGTLSYGGATMQTTTSMEYPAVNVPNYVIINNPTGVNLHATRTLLSLTLTNGHLILGTNNLIVSILGSINGASSSRYIVTNNTGALVINGVDNNNFTFPVGPNTILYHPVTINNIGTPDDFSVNLSSASAPACLPGIASVTETWNISEGTPLGSNCTLTFNYTGASVGGSYSSSGAQIAHCTGGTADYHNGSVTGSVATGTGFTTFSPFGITNDPTVLPVNFSTIKASQQIGGIKVEWSNLTETELINYSIDRSSDGNLFTSIGTASARLNNGGKADYTFFDVTAVDGVNFYRINAKGTNGSSKYSTIVRVNTKGGKTDLSIYPNPVSGSQVSFQATALPKGQYTVRVTNAGGQQVFSKFLLHNGGAITEALQLPATIKTGMFNLQVIGGEVNLTKTFIIR